ncbi:MAG: response regulator transcription factor [Gammaproteobacteria bacterium]|nr:response regulator transcription factor [Gammaproteobacteria bacterium]
MHPIYIVCRQSLVRRAFSTIIDEFDKGYLAGECDNCSELLYGDVSLRISIILIDLDEESPSSLKRLYDRHPKSKLILYSAFDKNCFQKHQLLANIRGYLSKYTAFDTARLCIESVTAGHIFIDPAISEHMLANLKERPGSILSEREMSVIQLMSKGMRNKEIADLLFITERTVKFHVSQIFKKLNVKNRTEAVRLAMADGIV